MMRLTWIMLIGMSNGNGSLYVEKRVKSGVRDRFEGAMMLALKMEGP